MKCCHNYMLLFLFPLLFTFSACRKSGEMPSGLTSLNIINAIPNGPGLIADINNQLPYYFNQLSVVTGGYQLYSFPAGKTNLILRGTSDTTTNLLTATFDLPNNSIHSFFVTGSLSSPDTLFVTDQPILFGGDRKGILDSTTGIRFVNLSQGSNPISINIQGQANGSEVTSLAYKGITGFRAYPATSGISSYSFEFRDIATGDLLATYNLVGVNSGTNGNLDINNVLYKNMTIAFQGLPGSQSAFLIQNF